MPNNTKETPSQSASAPETDASLEQRMASIEALLTEQRDAGKKMSRQRTIQSVLLLCLVVVFCVGFFSINRTLSKATEDLPALIQTTQQSVESTSDQLDELLTKINAIDFEGLNSTINGMEQGINSIDFNALNESIERLEEAAEALSKALAFLR